MRESKAKEAIVTTAQQLIEEKGYSNLNVNELAYLAEVSVGTLYYHFPKGKVDVLAEIMSRKTEGFVSKGSQLIEDDKILDKGMNLEDILRWLFYKIIELRRTDRQFLAAIQSEMFANPNGYLDLVKGYQTTDGLQQGMNVLSEVIIKVAERDNVSLGDIQDGTDRILKVVGLLMTYQIIFPGFFGKDSDFVDLAVDLFLDIISD